MSTVHILFLLSLTPQISEQQQVFVVRSGTTVTLPCGGGSPTQCLWEQAGSFLGARSKGDTMEPEPTAVDDITPDFIDGALEYFTVIFRSEDKPRSKRLNLTESCELKIRDVEAEDAGVYVCTHFNQPQSSSEVSQLHSESLLSVVKFSKDADAPRELVCDVYPYNGRSNCEYNVKWLVQGSDQNQLTFRTSQCLAEVRYSEGSSSPSLSCEVTDLNHNQVFVLQDPDSQQNQTVNRTEGGLEEPHDSLPVLSLLMLVIRFVELLMVSVVVVILLRVYSRCSSVNNHQKSKDTRAFRSNSLNSRVEESLV